MRDNPVAALTKYELRHLVAHLEAAGRDEDLHHLLALETNEGHNAWCKAKEAIADTQGYLDDTARAWRLAEAARDMPQQIHYALCWSSMKARVAHYPPELLGLAVEHQYLMANEALAIARQMPDKSKSAAALAYAFPYLIDSQLLEETLKTLSETESQRIRVRALASLAPYLSPPQLAEALQEALALVSPWVWPNDYADWTLEGIIADLLSYLARCNTAAVLAMANSIQDQYVGDRIRISLAQPLLEASPADAINMIESMKHEVYQAEALMGLIPSLPQECLVDALRIARTTERLCLRAQMLMDLVFRLPENLQAAALQDALSAAESTSSDAVRAQVLLTLTPHAYRIPSSHGAGVLGIAKLRTDMAALLAEAEIEFQHLPGYLPRELWTEPLQSYQVRRLVSVFLSVHTPQILHAVVLEEALAVTRSIDDATHQARLLAHLLPRFKALARFWDRDGEEGGFQLRHPAELPSSLSEVMQTWIPRIDGRVKVSLRRVREEMTRRFRQGHFRQSAADAVFMCNSGVRRREPNLEFLDWWISISDEWERLREMPKLAQSRVESVQEEALKVGRSIEDETERTETLVKLIPHISEPRQTGVLQDVFSMTRLSKIEDRESIASILVKLALYLPKDSPLLPEAFTMIWAIPNPAERIRMTTRLAPYLPRVLRTTALKGTLAAAQGIAEEGLRGLELALLAQHLAKPLRAIALRKAWSIAWRMEEEGLQELILFSILRFPKAALPGSFALTQSMPEEQRAKALVRLAPYLSEALMSEALATAETIQNEAWRSEALIGLIPCLPEALRAKAVAATWASIPQISNEQDRSTALVQVAPYLSRDQVTDAVKLAQGIGTKMRRIAALKGLVPYLPANLQAEIIQEALEGAASVWVYAFQIEVLEDLAPYLPVHLWPYALQLAGAIEHERMRVQGLAALLRDLPHNLVPGAVKRSAFSCAVGIRKPIWRAEALVALAPYLPNTASLAALDALDAAYDQLEPGESLSLQEERVVKSLLLDLTAYVPEDEIPLLRVLDLAMKLENKACRAEVLAGLVPYARNDTQMVIHSRLYDALAALLEFENERELAVALNGLGRGLYPDVLTMLEAKEGTGLDDIHTETPVRQSVFYNAVTPEARERRWVIALTCDWLGPVLSSKEKEQIAEIAERAGSTKPQIRVLSALPDYVSSRREEVYDQWTSRLRYLADLPRPKLLHRLCWCELDALLAIAAALTGSDEEALASAVFRAIQDVGRWWP